MGFHLLAEQSYISDRRKKDLSNEDTIRELLRGGSRPVVFVDDFRRIGQPVLGHGSESVGFQFDKNMSFQEASRRAR